MRLLKPCCGRMGNLILHWLIVDFSFYVKGATIPTSLQKHNIDIFFISI